MNDSINFQAVSEHYTNMSEGDRSCVVAMLQNSGAQQMTSINSHHDKFYEELSKGGWVKSANLSPELQEVESIRSWQFTDIGKSSMPNMLLALTTTSLRKELNEKCLGEITKFCLKLFTCYILCQICVFGVGFVIGKLDINISIMREYLPILGVLLSILASLFFASKVWFQKDPKEGWIRNIAYSEFIISQTKFLSIISAIIILAIHLMFEFSATQLGWQHEAKGITRLIFQSIVLGGIAYWLSQTMLPKIGKAYHDKQFQVRK